MLVIVLVFLGAAITLEAAEINCEKVESLNIYFGNGCYLDVTTVISEINSTIADVENSDVRVVLFEDNKNIHFLPVNIYKTFPNLETFAARNAAIKEISALNFKRLTNLNYLDLAFNQIKSIPNNCFYGLSELRQIFLGMEDNLTSA